MNCSVVLLIIFGAEFIEFFAVKDTFFDLSPSINCRGLLLDFSTPRVMGILNATPDSFYAGSRTAEADAIVQKAGQMLAEGADILDIGGYSSRPGAEDIPEDEELKRVIPAIGAVHSAFPKAIISVDTFRSNVAEKAVKAGAALVNDISGGSLDSAMHSTVASLRVPYVLMHMRGTPQTMTQHTDYVNVLDEVVMYFTHQIKLLRSNGVSDILIDPGFGFAKTREQSFALMRQLNVLKILNCPVMVGVSRKSMIAKTLGVSPDEALNGTTVLHTIALQQGAQLLRVHDVREAVEAISLFQKVDKATAD